MTLEVSIEYLELNWSSYTVEKYLDKINEQQNKNQNDSKTQSWIALNSIAIVCFSAMAHKCQGIYRQTLEWIFAKM
jgi:hypothetical protein